LIPLYPHVKFNFWSEINTKYTFLNSARSALYLIAKKYNNHFFLIPAYTCPTVLHALKQAGVEYNFIDIDNNLDFDIKDLSYMLEKYNNKDIVLVPTSLFGFKTRDYKKKYPDIIVVEDRAQGFIDSKSSADFQITSFGKGKMISGFGGGAIYDINSILTKKLQELGQSNEFYKSFLFAFLQKIISRVWFLLEGTRYDPEQSKKLDIDVIKPYRLSKLKRVWILNTLKNSNFSHRTKISNYYLQNIDKKYLFEQKKGIPYLRLPIKKDIKYSGLSKMVDFHETFIEALEKRGKELVGARQVLNSTCLPAHDLVTLEYAKKIVEIINE